MNKKLTLIELNEFNYDFLKEISFKYDLKNLKKLFSLKVINTHTNDDEEHKNLDPWVQWVSIHMGVESKKHQVFELGDIHKKKILQIWDLLSQIKIKCGIFGAMNSKYNSNEYIKFFVPDPWNSSQPIIPHNIKYFMSLAKYYATNYKKLNIKKLFLNFLKLFTYIIINLSTFLKFNIIKNIIIIINTFKLNSSGLFLINDYLSSIIYLKLKKKYDTDFNIIFLNSLAHFQHNYWTNENEKESKCFFYILNEIIGLLIFHNENYLIVNGFTQEKINKGEYIIYRQKDPENFLKKFNIRYQSLKQNMTNETRISFDSTKDLEIALKTLENIMIEGKKLLQIDTYSQHKEIIIKINIHKKFKNNYFLFQNKKIKIDDLIVGIERTGSHAQNGNIMTNLDIKEKNIYNHEIFKIIYNFYN